MIMGKGQSSPSSSSHFSLLSDGIKLAIILILLIDYIPSVWIKFSNYTTEKERSKLKKPLNLVIPNDNNHYKKESSFLAPNNIKGYQNSTLLYRWGQSTYEMSWKISIHVFAWKREKSLRRLCDSLLRANYYGYEVPLYIHVDGEPLDLVKYYVTELKWPHGPKIVNFRQERLGMPDAILSGWTPKSDDEYAILLEDDVEVAVSFFEFALYCLSVESYKKIVEGKDHGMMGCSLYTPRVDEIGPAPNAWSPPPWNPSYVVGPRHRVFNFQLPCSWGAIYNAYYWRQFLQYYSTRQQLGKDQFPLTPNSRSNEWFSSWKRILIELMLFRGWYLLYPSFQNQVSFSTQYFERGIHSVPEGVEPYYPNELRRGDRRFTVPLMSDFSFRASLPIPSEGMIKKIPFVSLYHKRVLNRQALLLDVKPFLDIAKSVELDHFFAKEKEEMLRVRPEIKDKDLTFDIEEITEPIVASDDDDDDVGEKVEI